MLLPPNGNRGGQWKGHRPLLNGIPWVLATGAPWRDLPERFGPWPTVYSRFRLWTRSGLWEQVLPHLQAQRQADGRIDGGRFFIDGSVARAHKAGARETLPAGERPDHALGRSRGGCGTKFHLVCEGQGLPPSVEVGPGQEHETRPSSPRSNTSPSCGTPAASPAGRPSSPGTRGTPRPGSANPCGTKASGR